MSIGSVRAWLLRMLVGDALTQLVIHVQQARSYADYLPGGINHDLVVADHVLSPEVAADAVRSELEGALALLGAEHD